MKMQRGIHIALMALLSSSVLAEKPERPRGHEGISGWPTLPFQKVEVAGMIEMEGYVGKIDGETQSDIVLATVAFDLEAHFTDWMLGHVGLLWEQYARETDNLDEAFIALGASENIPFYLIAGRFYQPVGNFESVFISNPLTLEMGEVNQVSAMIGYENKWIDLNAGAFNGDVEADVPVGEEGDNTINDFYASLTLTPAPYVQTGVYWLSDLMETWGLAHVGEEIANQPGYHKEGAAGAFVNLYWNIFTLNTEYISALNEYELFGGSYLPTAFNLELSAQVHEQVVVGLKYETSNDLFSAIDQTGPIKFTDKFPGQSYGIVIAYDFHEHARFAAEYLHADKLDNDARGDLLTVQLGLAF